MKAKLLSFVRDLKTGTPPRFQSVNRCLLLIVAMLTFGVTQVWGAVTSPYKHTFASGDITTSKQSSKTLSQISWAIDGATYAGIDATKGVQLGSSSNPQTSTWTMSTSVSKFGTGVTIESVKIGISTASKGGITYAISAGTASTGETLGATTSVTYKTLNCSVKSGDITISLQSTQSKAIYLKSVEITFSTGTPTSASAPSLTKACTFSTTPFEVTITNNESGATVYYTTDGNDPTTSSSSFTGDSKTIQISATTTVKAMAAISGKDNSEIVPATYTYEKALESIQEVIDATTSTETARLVKMTDWIISAKSSNNTAFITTNGSTIGMKLYAYSHGFSAGDKLNGLATLKTKTYDGYAEFTDLKSSTSGLTITPGASLTPVLVSDLSTVRTVDNQGALIKFTGATYNENGYFEYDEDNWINFDDFFYTGVSLENGKKYNVTGIIVVTTSSGTNYINVAPRSAADIEEAGCEQTVAVSKAATENGSFTISAEEVCADGEGGEISVTPSPDANYEVDQVSATVGTVGTPEDGVYPVTGITAATEISVSFKEKAFATIAWSLNGETPTGGTTKVYVGGKVSELPEVSSTYDCNGKKFVGWTNQPVTDGNKPGVLFTTAANAPTVTAAGNITYYAVFATQSGSEPTYGNVEHTASYTDFSGQGASGGGTAITDTIDGIEYYSSSAYGNTSYVQLYSGCTFTITSSNVIKSIVITTSANNNNNYSAYKLSKASGQQGTYSTTSGQNYGTWTAGSTDTKSVSFDASAQTRMTGVKVTTYEQTGGGYTYTDYATTCQATTYTISFVGNGATSGEMDDITGIAKDADQKLTKNAFAKTGYTFDGWSATVDLFVNDDVVSAGDKIADEATINLVDQDIELTARWSAIITTITLDKNGGISDGVALATYDSTKVLIDPAAKWAKHLLLGYTTAAASGDTIINSNGQLVANKSGYTTAEGKWCNTSAELTLYAQWQEISDYTITNTLTGCTADGTNPTTIDLEATDITLNYTLSEGYEWDDATVTVTMGGAELIGEQVIFDDGELYIAPTGGFTGNISVTITCKEELYVKLMDTGEKLEIVYGYVEVPNRTCKNPDYSFYGWSLTDCGTTDIEVAPDTVTREYGLIEVTESMELWPVFKKSESKTVWVKTAASAVAEGIYAVITTDGHAFNGSISSGHGQITDNAFSFTKDTATSAPSNTCEITMQTSSSGFKMYNKDKGYLYASAASSGKLAWHSSENSYWSWASSNWKYDTNGAYLRDYQNTTIRTYGSNNGSLIQFAKKVTSGKTYYNRKPANAVAAPVIAPAEGAYFGSVDVTITDENSNTIRYTLDGTEPTASSTLYESAISLTENKTVKAICIDAEGFLSPAASASYTIYKAFNSIEDLVAANPVNDSVQLTLSEAYVHAIQSSGSNELIYLQKGDRGVALSGDAFTRPDELTAGKQVSATIRGMYKISGGREQLNGYYFVGDPSIAAGTRPTAAEVSAPLSESLMARHLGLVKMENLYPQSKDGNLITMNTQADGQGTDVKLWNVLDAVKTLPDNTLACNVAGLFYRRIDTDTTYTIMPVQPGDFSLASPATATLPTVAPAGGATLAEAVGVPNNQVVVITPASGFKTAYSIADGEYIEITASKKEITLTEDTKLAVRATRDYYTDQYATHFYWIDPSKSAHDVNAPAVGPYTYVSDKASAMKDELVTLTITPNEHWYIDSVKAAYNTSDSIKCTSIGNNQYTFTMPEADVKIRVFRHSDPTYKVTYDKNNSSATGTTPSDKSYYLNEEVTIVDNPWTATGYDFTGWKVSYNNGSEEVIITPVNNKFNMPAFPVTIAAQWEEYIWHKPGAWTLVTNASDLAIGDYVIFADTKESSNYAGGAQSNANYRSTVSVSFSHDTLVFTNAPAMFRIEAGNVADTYAFLESGVGYLNASGTGTNNYLSSTASKASDNASFAVESIDATSGEAVVKAKSSNRNMLSLNDTRFSAYGQKQKGLAIYKFYRTCKTVTYKANAGEDVVTNMPDNQKADPDNNQVTISNSVPQRTGYTFASWNTQISGGGTTYVGGQTYTLTKNIDLKAQWTVNQYNMAVLTLDNITIKAKPYGLDTIFEGNSADIDYRKQITLSYSGLNSDYMFKSWKVTKADDASVIVTVDENNHFLMPSFAVTVTAVIEQKAVAKVYLTYDGNGGELIDPATQVGPFEYNYGTTINPLAGEIYHRDNCIFTGWNSKPDGTGSISRVPGGQLTITEDVTLYAQWQATGVTYHLNKDVEGKVEITSGEAPAGSSFVYVQDNSTLGQATVSYPNMTLTLSGYDGKIIKGVIMKMHTNKASGAGSITVTVGDNTLASTTYLESFGDYDQTTDWRIASLAGFHAGYVADGQKVVIQCHATESSLYLQDITIQYATADYVRSNLTIGRVSTVCVPYAVKPEDRAGAAFYEIAYKTQADDDATTKIYFDEVAADATLQAGKPYVFVPEQISMALIYSGSKKTEPVAGNKGLTGTFSKITDGAAGTVGNVLENNYIFNNNMYWLCEGNCWLDANRAYIDKEIINADCTPVSPAPGRRRIVMGANGTEEVTALSEEMIVPTASVRKLVIDNQLIIIRGGKMYNAAGALVK